MTTFMADEEPKQARKMWCFPKYLRQENQVEDGGILPLHKILNQPYNRMELLHFSYFLLPTTQNHLIILLKTNCFFLVGLRYET